MGTTDPMALKARTLRQRDPRAMAFDARQSAARRGYSADWAKLAKRFLTAFPLCSKCFDEGRATPAALVHHVQGVDPRHPERRLDWNNLQSLCRPCHGKVHASGGRGQQ